MEELKDFIKDYVVKKRFVSASNKRSFWEDRGAGDLFDVLMSSKREGVETVNQAVYDFLHDIQTPPTCKVCDSETKYRSFKEGYSHYCSSRCVNLDPHITTKKEESCLRAHGVKNVLANRDKMRDSYLRKYGVDNPMKDPEIAQKSRGTYNSRYTAEEITKKVSKTKMELYGDPYFSDREKVKNTCLERYGRESSMHIARECFKDMHGADNPSQLPWVQEIKARNSIERYGKLFQQHHLSNDGIEKFNDLVFLSTHSAPEISRLTGYSQSHVSKNLIKHNLLDGFKSYGERDVFDMLISLGLEEGDIITNSRSIIPTLELDFYLPEYDVAIEFNGDWFHSANYGKDHMYHYEKFRRCKDIGIQLFQIQECEWNDPFKGKIWKSMINNALKRAATRVFARKCELREVDSKTSKEFLLENHLQGTANGSVRLGLFFEDNLVALGVFGKYRFGSQKSYELVRLAYKMNHSVVGGFSKLLKHFLDRYGSSLVSFSDNRYSIGKVYESNGFYKESENIGYYYIKNGTMFNRMKFQKHKLSDILDEYDDTLTESENMMKNGYLKVYDAGQTKWTLS